MATNSIGFLEFTKLVARDAFVEYFNPVASVVRTVQRRWLTFRVAALAFRSNRETRGFWAASDALLRKNSDETVDVPGVDLSNLEAEIRTLRATIAFFELRRKSRLNLAAIAERTRNFSLRRELVTELHAIESELVELQRRLSLASYKYSIHSSSDSISTPPASAVRRNTISLVLRMLADRRYSPGYDPEIRALIDRPFMSDQGKGWGR